MEHQINPSPEDYSDKSIKKDRSLLYMGSILAVIILVMGYLTFFVDDVSKLFSSKEETVNLVDDKSDILDENAAMSDAEVRRSLVKFIEAFYFDQRRGYFDPPSYFASITQTYYNFHNLTYQRLRDIHNKRLKEMRNLDQNWIVSSLDFKREGSKLVATYWLKVSYFKPAWNKQESADIKHEMIIEEDGKISSLRELEVKNFNSYEVAPIIDTLGGEDTSWQDPQGNIDEPVQNSEAPSTESEATKYEGRLYDLGSVETSPEYPGGNKALGKFLGLNLKYPQAARENNTQGKVYVGFVVEKSGQLSDLKIIKGIGYGCDEEALRVLKNSIAWTPGMIGGKPVRTSYTLPITFQVAN
ncbi:energy transducer TonB [Daejeonella oryzae]|uniref:energy transducer TonB n=1 Tax=Daejeonella oryzae TaxID=1122943 RepID=UPI0006847476|nr:energy transducer TonB [Daejeonella oryzae]